MKSVRRSCAGVRNEIKFRARGKIASVAREIFNFPD